MLILGKNIIYIYSYIICRAQVCLFQTLSGAGNKPEPQSKRFSSQPHPTVVEFCFASATKDSAVATPSDHIPVFRAHPWRIHPSGIGHLAQRSSGAIFLLRLLCSDDRASRHALVIFGGSPVVDSTSRTRYIRMPTRRATISIASSSSTTSGQAPRDYIDCVRYMTYFPHRLRYTR
jgi:hypothetical protein